MFSCAPVATTTVPVAAFDPNAKLAMPLATVSVPPPQTVAALTAGQAPGSL